MSAFRQLFCIIVTVALVCGYGFSQWSLFNGDAAEYATKVDSPLVSALAAIVLLASVVLAFIRTAEDKGEIE